MSISIVRDQSWIGRLPQASTVQRVPPVQKVSAPVGESAAPSADPRAIAALTDALSVFLQQINGAAAPAETPPTPAVKDHTRDTLGHLKDDFDGLLDRLGLAAGGVDAGQDADAATRLKADVSDFVGGLLKVTEEVTKGMTAPVVQTAVAAVAEPKQEDVAPIRANLPDATSAYAENAAFVPKPAEENATRSPSLFSSLGARLQRHFEEL